MKQEDMEVALIRYRIWQRRMRQLMPWPLWAPRKRMIPSIGLSQERLLNTHFNFCFRQKMYEWLKSLKQPDGSYIMHHEGEVDIR
jgi:hypothetical protein